MQTRQFSIPFAALALLLNAGFGHCTVDGSPAPVYSPSPAYYPPTPGWSSPGPRPTGAYPTPEWRYPSPQPTFAERPAPYPTVERTYAPPSPYPTFGERPTPHPSVIPTPGGEYSRPRPYPTWNEGGEESGGAEGCGAFAFYPLLLEDVLPVLESIDDLTAEEIGEIRQFVSTIKVLFKGNNSLWQALQIEDAAGEEALRSALVQLAAQLANKPAPESADGEIPESGSYCFSAEEAARQVIDKGCSRNIKRQLALFSVKVQKALRARVFFDIGSEDEDAVGQMRALLRDAKKVCSGARLPRESRRTRADR